MRSLEQRAMARAGEVIDASTIDGPALKEQVRNRVSAVLDLHPFDDALALLARETSAPGTDTGAWRQLMSRVILALDTRWLLARAAEVGDEDDPDRRR